MKIRKTRPEELPFVLTLYEKAREFMAAHGNPNQWGTNRPAVSRVEEDIRERNSYVCEHEGRIVATFYFGPGPDPTYGIIDGGQWLSDRPYSVVHRITSDGSVKGAASFCLQWAFEQSGNVRIDTHRDNIVMQNLLKKNGFSYCGIIYLENGDERLAYQKEADGQV